LHRFGRCSEGAGVHRRQQIPVDLVSVSNHRLRLERKRSALKHQNDMAMLEELTTELADIWSNKWPRVDLDAATGKMKIGRASIRDRK
jgi:hypothetical protein